LFQQNSKRTANLVLGGAARTIYIDGFCTIPGICVFVFEMSEVKCPECEFLGRGSRLSNARKAVRIHALRVHRAVFDAEADMLRPCSPHGLQHRLAALNYNQMNSAQRRALRARAASGGGGLPRHGGIAPSASGNPCTLGMPDLTAAGGLPGHGVLHPLSRVTPVIWVCWTCRRRRSSSMKTILALSRRIC